MDKKPKRLKLSSDKAEKEQQAAVQAERPVKETKEFASEPSGSGDVAAVPGVSDAEKEEQAAMQADRPVKETTEFASESCSGEDVAAVPGVSDIKEQSDASYNINDFPEEVLEKIFSYLNIRELCRAGQACKRWHTISRSPHFWRKVHVDFNIRRLDNMGETIMKFADMLLPHVTHLKVTFDDYRHWTLNFTEFVKRLRVSCPLLHTLNLQRAPIIGANRCSVLNTAAKLLPNIRVLVFHQSYLVRGKWIDCNDRSRAKIEVLNISYCIQDFDIVLPTLSDELSPIEKLRDKYLILPHVPTTVSKLKFLDLESTRACSFYFLFMHNDLSNSTELFMCFTDIMDDCITFSKSFRRLRRLKIVCLRGCMVTPKGIKSFIKSCPSLQHVYVGGLSGTSHPIDYSMCNSEKVEVIYSLEKCKHYSKVDYMQV